MYLNVHWYSGTHLNGICTGRATTLMAQWSFFGRSVYVIMNTRERVSFVVCVMAVSLACFCYSEFGNMSELAKKAQPKFKRLEKYQLKPFWIECCECFVHFGNNSLFLFYFSWMLTTSCSKTNFFREMLFKWFLVVFSKCTAKLMEHNAVTFLWSCWSSLVNVDTCCKKANLSSYVSQWFWLTKMWINFCQIFFLFGPSLVSIWPDSR